MTAKNNTTILIDNGWKFKATLSSLAILALVTVAFLYRFEFGLLMLGFGGVAMWRGLVWIGAQRGINHHNARRMEAETIKAEIEADILAEKLEQERQKTDEYRIKKHFIETKVGVFRWTGDGAEPLYIPASAGERKQLTIEAEARPVDQLDYLTVMSDPLTGYAIFGPQRVGKSYAAMHVTDYLAARQLGLCLLIGVKMEAGEWPNCKQFIGEAAIRRALRNLIATIGERHDYQQKTPRLNVILDDWINIVAIAPELAEEFFVRAATDALAAGVVCYFLLQSDTREDWGTKHGAMLQKNFTRVYLEPTRRNGVIDPTATTAKIAFAGEHKNQAQPVQLPAGRPALQFLPVADGITRNGPEPACEPLVQLPEFADELDRDIYQAVVDNYAPGETVSYSQLFKAGDWSMSKPTFIKHVKRVASEHGLVDAYDFGADFP